MSKRTDEVSELVKLSNTAKKFIDSTDANTYARIKEALTELTLNPPQGDIKPLVGRKPLMRAVVGKYRIIFYFSDGFVKVVDIDNRGQVYKRVKGGKYGNY